jgi:hypothetical protein
MLDRFIVANTSKQMQQHVACARIEACWNGNDATKDKQLMVGSSAETNERLHLVWQARQPLEQLHLSLC